MAGVVADAIDFTAAILIVAALTAASGLWVLLDMPSTRSRSSKRGDLYEATGLHGA